MKKNSNKFLLFILRYVTVIFFDRVLFRGVFFFWRGGGEWLEWLVRVMVALDKIQPIQETHSRGGFCG